MPQNLSSDTQQPQGEGTSSPAIAPKELPGNPTMQFSAVEPPESIPSQEAEGTVAKVCELSVQVFSENAEIVGESSPLNPTPSLQDAQRLEQGATTDTQESSKVETSPPTISPESLGQDHSELSFTTRTKRKVKKIARNGLDALRSLGRADSDSDKKNVTPITLASLVKEMHDLSTGVLLAQVKNQGTELAATQHPQEGTLSPPTAQEHFDGDVNTHPEGAGDNAD